VHKKGDMALLMQEKGGDMDGKMDNAAE